MDKTSPKFKNFNKLPRYLNYDLFSGKITFNEFGLLLIYAMNTDWDSRHKNFGTVCLSNSEVGKIIGLNRNKITGIKNQLVKKGYISKIGIHNGIERIRIHNFDDDFQTRINWKDKESYEKIFREIDKQL